MRAARKALAEVTALPQEVKPSAPLPASSLPAWQAAAGLGLAELVGPGLRGAWQVRVGALTLEAEVDPSVDPAFLAECRQRNRRVLIAGGERPVIVGALQSRRVLEIDPEGSVAAEVESFRVKATKEVTLQTAAAFIQVKAEEVELFGERVLTRARGVAKTLARMISLN